jgi:CubicO group peptidase (beta-lactamase class C family)
MEDRDDYFCNTSTWKKGEIVSGNIYSSAHDLAVIGQKLINGEILSLLNLEVFHSEPVRAVDHSDGNETNFTKGGVNAFGDDFMGEGFYGWMGYGGSLFCWNPA